MQSPILRPAQDSRWDRIVYALEMLSCWVGVCVCVHARVRAYGDQYTGYNSVMKKAQKTT